MKNKLLAVSVAVILLALVAGGTLAWFQYEDTAVNLVTTGSVLVSADFTMLSGGSEVRLEPDPDDPLMPGSERSGIVRVRNAGASPAYVRARIVKEWIRDGASTDLPAENIVLDINSEDWKTIGDWHYYLRPLSRGSSTEPLFTEIMFAGNGVSGVNDNVYQNTVIRLTVVAEAVQAANNAIRAVWGVDSDTWTIIPGSS